jgi:hypothetical protein
LLLSSHRSVILESATKQGRRMLSGVPLVCLLTLRHRSPSTGYQAANRCMTLDVDALLALEMMK